MVRWVLAGFGLTLLLGLGALTWWWDEIRILGRNLASAFDEEQYAEGFEDKDDVLAYLKHHPSGYSLVTYTVEDDGSESGPSVEHRSGEPMPLASTKKVVILGAYAGAVSEGELDPEREVRVSEWEKYYLPGTDGGAHGEALQKLGLRTNEKGYAADPRAEVPMEDVARAMIESSDNAATDYLMARLGEDRIQAVIEDENLEGQETILPLLGSIILWLELDREDPDLSEQISGERLEELRSLSDKEYAAEVRDLTEAYARGGIGNEWREDGPPVQDLRYQKAVANDFETKGTAQDYARIMARVAAGTFISPEASEIMRRHLDWPTRTWAKEKGFRTFGAKGGSLSGVLNQSTYAVPERGDFAGETRVTVLFVDEMSGGAWLGARQRPEGYRDFVAAMASDEAFVRRVERELEG